LKQTLIEIKNLLNEISVKGDDVMFMAEAQVRVNKLLKECESEGENNNG